MAKLITGIILILVGIFVGLYVGVWLMFVGGIVGIIEQIRAENLVMGIVAWNIVKIVLAGFCGTICAYIFLLPGLALIKDA